MNRFVSLHLFFSIVLVTASCNDTTMNPPPVSRSTKELPEADNGPEQLDHSYGPPEIVVELANGIELELVRIPAGVFTMGSPKTYNWHVEDEYQHEVEITYSFYIGKYEVTQEQFEQVIGVNPTEFSIGGIFKDRVDGLDTRRFPVESVTWYDAAKFCETLTARQSEHAAGRKYRLPTEAEWEYACRGGVKEFQLFSYGDSLTSYEANFDGYYPHPFATGLKGPNLKRPTYVGNYKPNGFGVYDMHGNVSEWCQDWYEFDYYKKSRTRDPKGPTSGELKVSRGGNWSNGSLHCTCADRERNNPNSDICGFRVVCILTKSP